MAKAVGTTPKQLLPFAKVRAVAPRLYRRSSGVDACLLG